MDTYQFPANITNCSNNYGPYQFPEKLIPLIINNALQGKQLPVYEMCIRDSNTELPKIVIVGDSYTWMFMLPWISESFSETVFIHQLDGGNLQSVIDVVQPDIVVFTGLHNTVEAAIKQIAETDVLSEE